VEEGWQLALGRRPYKNKAVAAPPLKNVDKIQKGGTQLHHKNAGLGTANMKGERKLGFIYFGFQEER